MRRGKNIGLTGAALEKALRKFPKDQREKMRPLLAPFPTFTQIKRKKIAELKVRTTLAQRQAVLNSIRSAPVGRKLSEIAAEHQLDTWDVYYIEQMNQKRHVFYTLNEVSV